MRIFIGSRGRDKFVLNNTIFFNMFLEHIGPV
jgi:hypothetical protein